MIEALTSVPVQKVEENLSDDIPLAAQDRLNRQAATCRSNFSNIFLKFADVHHGINHAERLDVHNLKQIGIYNNT